MTTHMLRVGVDEDGDTVVTCQCGREFGDLVMATTHLRKEGQRASKENRQGSSQTIYDESGVPTGASGFPDVPEEGERGIRNEVTETDF